MIKPIHILLIDYGKIFQDLKSQEKFKRQKNIKYFGPYSTGAKDMLDSIYEIVPLLQKKSCVKVKLHVYSIK